jgi:endonuclease-3
MLLQRRLIERARETASLPPVSVPFASKPAADVLVKDIKGHPHAYVIACLMDRQTKAERAWGIPYELQQRLGSFEFPFLLQLPMEQFETAMQQPTLLHRYYHVTPNVVYKAIHRIDEAYGGDASAIWSRRPSSATVVRRFLEFDGAGTKIATMAANILVRDLRVEVADRYSIDISVDVHIRRVFARMGFVSQDASEEYIIYRAREMNPEYPGIFDLVFWDLGRTLCGPREPVCSGCEWRNECVYANSTRGS